MRARLDYLPRLGQAPTRKVTRKSTRYDAVAIDMYADEVGSMGRHGPERTSGCGFPESELPTTTATDDHGAIRRERRVAKKAGATAVRLLKISGFAIP